MKQLIKRILFFLLGLMGWVALLCSIAASQVTNAALMKQGFLQYAQTAALGVPASRYGDYAVALSDYLDGKTDLPRVPAQDGSGGVTVAFSEKENLHLKDVRGIVDCLKWARWLGGGGVLLIVAGLYLLKKKERDLLLRSIVRGYALSALALAGLSLGLGIWGGLNFPGLFWTFHQVVFTNDLWLLNPQTDLLVALMPLPFFTWYAGEILKSLLPILGVMILVVIAHFKTKERV